MTETKFVDCSGCGARPGEPHRPHCGRSTDEPVLGEIRVRTPRGQARRRFEMRWRPGEISAGRTIDDLIEGLENSAANLRDLRDVGVILSGASNLEEGRAVLVTTEPPVAACYARFGFEKVMLGPDFDAYFNRRVSVLGFGWGDGSVRPLEGFCRGLELSIWDDMEEWELIFRTP